MSVSLAMIVKNEERVLARCLDHLRPHVDEIVVVDTGSTDTTKAIAERYADQLLDFAWRDDFAAARQFAFDHATGDWVMWIDADDVVLGAENIRGLAARAPADIDAFYWRYVTARDDAGAPTRQFWRERLVRNDGTFRWVGRVHEVLDEQRPVRTLRVDEVVVDHQPEPEGEGGDSGRNLRILEHEYADAGGALPPRQLFYLAREQWDHGNLERAIELFHEYLAIGEWADERYLAQTHVATLLRMRERYDEAIDADLAALKIHPHWPMAYFGLARSYYFLQDWPKVIHWTDLGRQMPIPETTLFLSPLDFSLHWIIYYTNALFGVGDIVNALDWTLRALELDPDNEWHRNSLEYYTRLLAKQGNWPDAEQQVPELATYAVIPVRDKHPQTFALLSQLGLPAERVVVVDGGSRIPAREAFSGLADVIECTHGGVAELWNAGLDRVASLSNGSHNVAVLANTIVVEPGFLSGLAAGLRGSRDCVIAYPDWERRLPAGDCDPEGQMSGFAFMLRGEDGLRADPQFLRSWADVDLERWARLQGEVVCVGGVHANDGARVLSETSDPGSAQSNEDWQRFEAKWGTTPG